MIKWPKVLATLTAVIILCGCGGTNEPKSKEKKKEVEKKEVSKAEAPKKEVPKEELVAQFIDISLEYEKSVKAHKVLSIDEETLHSSMNFIFYYVKSFIKGYTTKDKLLEGIKDTKIPYEIFVDNVEHELGGTKALKLKRVIEQLGVPNWTKHMFGSGKK